MSGFIELIKRYDKTLIFLFLGAVSIGLFFIYSATKSMNGGTKYIIIQSVGLLLGIGLMIIISYINYEDLAELWKYFAGISIFLLVLVLIIGIGAETTGTKGWIRIGPLSLQPAELVKIFFILTLSKHLSKIGSDINYIKNVIALLFHLAIPLGLVLLQPDMGTSMVFIFIFLVMTFVAGINWIYIGALFGAGASVCVIAWFFILDQFQKNRIFAFLNPESASQTYGYHVMQSKIAVGSGQILGKGYLKGIQTQLGYLPEKHTDFIFSVIGEEGGIIMCLVTVGVLMALVLRAIKIARESKTPLGSFICMGVSAMWLFHIFENIGMTIGLMPVTGIPLPFISYGGSSMLSNCMAMGLVLNVAIHSRSLKFSS